MESGAKRGAGGKARGMRRMGSPVEGLLAAGGVGGKIEKGPSIPRFDLHPVPSARRIPWGTLVPKRFADLPHTPFAVTDVLRHVLDYVD